MDQTFYAITTNKKWTFGNSFYIKKDTYDEAEEYIKSVSEEDTGHVERYIFEVKVIPVMKATSERTVNFGEWDGYTESVSSDSASSRLAF